MAEVELGTVEKTVVRKAMKKILVVESEYPILGLSGALFRRRECVLQVASSGAEALTSAEQDPPDLVIFDGLVTDFSIQDFVQALHSSNTGDEIPVMAILNDDDEGQDGRLLRAGASAVLSRSTDEIALNVKVCELLGISLRRHLRTFVKLKADATMGGSAWFATIANISLGGVFIETDQKLRIGEFIKLQFFLPGDDEAHTIIAKISRDPDSRESPGYGCRFMDLTDSARERIHEFVAQADPDD